MVGEKHKILWVDDEIELLKPHVIFLKDKGFNVDTATNGQDAIEMVKQNVRDGNYDLILLDEMMAGMGGLSTLEVIKGIAPEIPVVMITKNEAESLMEEAIGQKDQRLFDKTGQSESDTVNRQENYRRSSNYRRTCIKRLRIGISGNIFAIRCRLVVYAMG